MGTRYNPSIVTNGLVFYFDSANSKSYPGSGNLCYDLAAGYTGSISASVWAPDGKGSFSFNGVTSLITTNFSASSLGQQFTISAWARAATGCATNYKGLIGSHGVLGTGYRGILFMQYENGTWYIGYGTGTNYNNRNSLFPFELNRWYNIVGVYDCGTSLTVYSNGDEYVQSGLTGGIGHDTVLWFGKSYIDSNRYWTGSLSNVAVYNRLLTREEVLKNYNAVKGRFGL